MHLKYFLRKMGCSMILSPLHISQEIISDLTPIIFRLPALAALSFCSSNVLFSSRLLSDIINLTIVLI